MIKILIFSIAITLSTTNASIDDNKHNGHGIFQSFEELEKRAWVEEPKFAEKFIHTKITPELRHDDSLTINVVPTKNDLLDNSDSKLRPSSLYLQPEPRGLQYLLNTGDYNPFLLHYMRKREVDGFVGYPNGQGQNRCHQNREKIIMCVLRKRRDIPQGNNVIPGSRGQAVLYGVPGSNFQNLPNGGLPNGGFPNGGFPNGGVPNSGFPNGGFQNGGFQNGGSIPKGPIQNGYKTYGY